GVGARVRFRHPLVRSAVYRSAALPDCRAAHLALAEVTDRDLDPDRRAWHLAAAAAGPDEQVAAELERSAGRAQARGGLAAAAAFLQRAVALTAEPGPRAGRALAAAHASLQAGAFDAALELVTTAEAGPLDDLQRAQVSLLRGQIAFAAGAVGEAPALLLQAARQLEPLDGALARQTYLDAWTAAAFAGRFAQDGNLHEVSRAARSAPPPPTPPAPGDLLLDGLAVLVTDGRAAAAPMLRRVARIFAEDEIATEEGLRWGWVAATGTSVLWDVENSQSILLRQLQSAREAGMLVHLLRYVNMLGILATWCGQFAEDASLVAAYAPDRLVEATSISQTDWGPGVHARSRALLSDGEDAETSYREAIERLGRTPLRPDLARAHLLYGEWLRRQSRRADARAQP